MSFTGKQRAKTRTGVRSTLALVLVAMLNLVVQPCSMAMTMASDSEHPCPHCPDGIEHAIDIHASADGAVAGCDVVEAYNRDARSGQIEFKNPLDDLAPAAEIFSPWQPARVSGDAGLPARSAEPPNGPPLNILYCVYLD